ncbi:MAG: class I SAM-dependent methyltransferase [Pseudomonadota bacterium]
MADAAPVKLELSGVPETMLWPLYYRVQFSQSEQDLLQDPMAANLVQRIDYDFAGHFGKGNVGHAIRARYGDDLIRRYARDCRVAGIRPVVVALGEGLETQAWRVGDSSIYWVTVDLPEAIAAREKLLPELTNGEMVACSALDLRWLDHLPDNAQPLICAMGLLMYFESADIQNLLRGMAEHLPMAELCFDTIPPSFSSRAMKGMRVTPSYTAPQMPWGIALDDVPAFVEENGWQVVIAQTYAHPYPEYIRFYRWLSRIGPMRRAFAPGLVHARLAAGASA